MTLIERLKERANDPMLARDEDEGITRGGKPAKPPATPEQVASAEKKLGFALPALLRQVYLEVGNGGFGPGYGLFSLPTPEGDADTSIVGRYAALCHGQAKASPPWPVGLIPLCEWGYGIASSLDCSGAEAPVVRLDPNMAKADVALRVPVAMHFEKSKQVTDACWVESASLEEWLTAWVDGKKLFYLGYGGASADADEDAEEEDIEEGEEDAI